MTAVLLRRHEIIFTAVQPCFRLRGLACPLYAITVVTPMKAPSAQPAARFKRELWFLFMSVPQNDYKLNPEPHIYFWGFEEESEWELTFILFAGRRYREFVSLFARLEMSGFNMKKISGPKWYQQWSIKPTLADIDKRRKHLELFLQQVRPKFHTTALQCVR